MNNSPISKHPELNTAYHFIMPERWVYEQAVLQYRKTHPTEHIKKANEAGLKAVQNLHRSFQAAKKKGVEHLKPLATGASYALSTFGYISNEFEKRVQRLLIDNPGDKKLLSQWEEFQCKIAHLRYHRDPSLIQEAHTFVEKFYQDHSFENMKEKDIDLPWKLWEEIFRDPNILDISFSAIVGGTPPIDPDKKEDQTFQIGVHHLQEAFGYIAEQMRQSLSWLIPVVIKKMTPFLSLPQHQDLNYSQGVIKHAERITKELLPDVACLVQNKIDAILDHENLLLNIKEQYFLMTDNKTRRKKEDCPFGWYGIFNDTFKVIIEAIERESPKDLICLDDYLMSHKTSTFIMRPDNYSLGTWKREEIYQIREFQEATISCHILLDTYMGHHVVKLCHIMTALKSWRKAHATLSLTEIVSKPFEGAPSVDDIDAWVNLIDGEKKQKKDSRRKVVKKAPRQKAKPKAIPKSKNKAKERQVSFHHIPDVMATSKIPKLSELGKARGLVSQIDQILVKTGNSQQKSALRQARLHLTDLIYIIRRLNHDPDTGDMLSLLSAVESSSYYLMEQCLRHQLLLRDPNAKDRRHDLRYFVSKLPGLKHLEAVNALYLANHWVRSPFRQMHMRRWYKAEVPPALTYLVDDSKLKDAVPPQLMTWFNQTIRFSSQFFEVEKDTSHHKTLMLKPRANLSVKPFQNLAQHCRHWLNDFHLMEGHPAYGLIKQSIQRCSHLENAISILNGEEVSPDAFAYGVRMVIYWQNALFEGILQVAQGLQKGTDTWEHDLVQLTASTIWDEDFSEEELSFLNENFAKINTSSRYPFDNDQPKSTLHTLILQSELLRERPEIDQQFSINGITSLNFIPVPIEGLSSKSVCEKLAKVIVNSLTILNRHAVPMINYTMQVKFPKIL